MVVGVDSLGIRVVERVIGFEAQFDPRSFMRRERNGLEQREIPVEDSRSDSRIFSSISKALVRTAVPRGDRISVRTGAEPLAELLGIGDLRHQVRTVGCAAAQTESIGAAISNAQRHSFFCNCYTGDRPASNNRTSECVGTALGKWESVNVAHIEDV